MASAAASGLSAALGIGSLKKSQLEILQTLVSKHLVDSSLIDIASKDDFTITSLERGIPRYEHSHLVAALDVFLAYQRTRRAQGPYAFCPSMKSSFKQDPRTRLIELYKRWLRTNAANASVGEDDVRRMCALCRDVLNHPRLFPSRNPRSFMHTLAEVYDHMKLQLREVLEHDRTCAELATRALCLSRNLISDAITYLLLAATDLKQTDKLPSVEVVYLWQSLPADMNPLPARADKALQKLMKDVWLTQCGSLISSLLCVRWAFRLFDGAGAEDEAVATVTTLPALKASGSESPASSGHPAESIPLLIAQIGTEFEKGNFKTSGLAGAFREPGQSAGRQSYLGATEAVFDLIYLLGDVLVQFHRISDGLGDYGMIRVAPWLHPFLEALIDKVKRLRDCLESLNHIVDAELVLAKARGQKVKKPVPTQTMSARAHASIDRAITGGQSHASLLLQVFEELRSQSAPERLPHVMEGLGDACAQLQNVLASPQFLARVGDTCRDLPALSTMTTMSQIGDAHTSVVVEEVDGEMSEEEGSMKSALPLSGLRQLGRSPDSRKFPAEHETGDSVVSKTSESSSITGFHLRRRAASVGRAGRDALSRLRSRRSTDSADAARSDIMSSMSSDLPVDADSPADRRSNEEGIQNTLDSTAASPSSCASPGHADASPGGSPPGHADASPGGSPTAEPIPLAACSAPSGAGDSGTPGVDEPTAAIAQPSEEPESGGDPIEPAAELQSSSMEHVDPPLVDPPLEAPRQAPTSGDIQADVYRLTLALKGWVRHDLRCLLVRDGELHIFEKSSKDQVKTMVKVADELDQCSLLGDGIMSLKIQRAKRSRLLWQSSLTAATEEREQKIYFFEFCDPSLAEEFRSELSRLRGLGPGLSEPGS